MSLPKCGLHPVHTRPQLPQAASTVGTRESLQQGGTHGKNSWAWPGDQGSSQLPGGGHAWALPALLPGVWLCPVPLQCRRTGSWARTRASVCVASSPPATAPKGQCVPLNALGSEHSPYHTPLLLAHSGLPLLYVCPSVASPQLCVCISLLYTLCSLSGSLMSPRGTKLSSGVGQRGELYRSGCVRVQKEPLKVVTPRGWVHLGLLSGLWHTCLSEWVCCIH